MPPKNHFLWQNILTLAFVYSIFSLRCDGEWTGAFPGLSQLCKKLQGSGLLDLLSQDHQFSQAISSKPGNALALDSELGPTRGEEPGNVLFAIIVIFRLRLLCGCCEEIILQRYRRLNYCFEAPPRKPSFNPKNHQLQQKFKCWWIKIRIFKLNILAELAIRHFSNNLSWNSKGGWEISERVDTIRKLARWNRVRTARVALKIPRRRDNSSKDVFSWVVVIQEISQYRLHRLLETHQVGFTDHWTFFERHLFVFSVGPRIPAMGISLVLEPVPSILAQIFIGHSTQPYVNARDAITKRK